MSLIKQDISQLLVLCKQDNNLAQLEVYNRYEQAMFNTSIRIVKDSAIAEDVMQESFLTAFTKLDSFKGTSTFGAWLKRIVINNSISQYRKMQRFVPLEENTMEEDNGEEEMNFDGISSFEEQDSKVKHLLTAVSSLKGSYSQMLTLHFIDGYDYNEICTILDISNANCRTTMSRAKESLRKKMNVS